MFARVTRFEAASRDVDLDAVQGTFERLVVPEMRKQPGYEGCYLLRTREGAGLVVALWESEDAMRSSETGGAYAEHVERFRSLLGRRSVVESYEVAYADHPIA